MCRLLESLLCVDGKIQNIEFHQNRVNAAFQQLLPNSPSISLKNSIIVPADYSKGSFRVRVIYDTDVISIEFLPTVPRSFKTFKLVNDDLIDYSCKYENRNALTTLLNQKDGADEVIIVKNGCITDTSISNLLFHDGQQWFTPDTPLLKGTMRQSLLDKKICTEKHIALQDLPKYKHVLMVNAILGFHPENAVSISSILNLDSFR